MSIKEWALGGLGFIVGMSFRVGYRYWARGSGPWAVSQIPCYRSNSCCLRLSIIPVDTFITGSLCNDQQWRTQDFSMGGSVTSHRDDVKMLQLAYSSSEVLKCIGL